MPDTASITLIKRFTYRGQNEEWSNTYHFKGVATPGDAASWKTLIDALIAQEKTILPNTQKYVRAYGYAPGNEHSVAQVDYVALGGTLVQGTLATPGNSTPGDTAFMLRALVGTSSTGKKVYVRKYFHGAGSDTTADNIIPAQKTAAETFGAKLLDGTSIASGFKWCGPQGADASTPYCSPYLTTRTLKRRGKRPH